MQCLRFSGVVIATAFSLGNAAQFEPPRPEAFQRPLDQERARLLRVPCAEKDIGRGCYKHDGRLIREYPCSYHIDQDTIGSLRTEHCFKMEIPRRYSGIWIDEFEGQQFIPDHTEAVRWPDGPLSRPDSQTQFDRARAATIWIDTSRVKIARRADGDRRKVRIAFIGRKTLYPGSYGHMGMSGQYIVVDRVLAAKELD